MKAPWQVPDIQWVLGERKLLPSCSHLAPALSWCSGSLSRGISVALAVWGTQSPGSLRHADTLAHPPRWARSLFFSMILHLLKRWCQPPPLALLWFPALTPEFMLAYFSLRHLRTWFCCLWVSCHVFFSVRTPTPSELDSIFSRQILVLDFWGEKMGEIRTLWFSVFFWFVFSRYSCPVILHAVGL